MQEYNEYRYTVADDNGNTLTDLGDVSIDLDQAFSYTVQSNVNNWTCTYSVNKSEINFYSQQIQRTIIILYLIVLLLSILLAVYFSSMTVNPLVDIYDKLNIDNTGKNIWLTLKESVFDMANNNDSLKKQYVDYCITVEENFTRRLLTGYTFSTNELKNLPPPVYNFMSHAEYSVATIVFEQEFADITNSVISVNLLKSHINSKNLQHIILDIDNTCVLIIMSDTINTKSHYMGIYNDIHKNFQDKNIDARICLGGEVNTCDKIYLPFQQAMSLFDFLPVVNDKIIVYDQISNSNSTLNYTIDNEQQLTQLIMTANYDKAIEVIVNLINVACESTQLKRARYVIRSLLWSMERIKYRMLTLSEEQNNTIETNFNVIELLITNTALQKDDIISSFKCIIKAFTECIRLTIAEKNNTFAQRIKEYICSNYANKSLCIAEIADAMSFSENYVSSTFKQHTGQNISLYIEKFRLEKSLELLKTTDDTVQNISNLVGYSSINTFNKAFKRNYSCTPIEYRKSNIEI